MSVQRVGTIQERQPVGEQQIEEHKRRLDLFTSTSFERGSSVTFADGSRFSVPELTSDQHAKVQSIYDSASPEARVQIDAAVRDLTGAIRNELATNPQVATSGAYSDGLRQALATSVQAYSAAIGTGDESSAVDNLMLLAVSGWENDLQQQARGVKAQMALAGETRTDIAELRDALGDWPDDGSTKEFTWREVTFGEDGKPQVVEHTESLTKADAQTLADKLEGQLSTLSEQNELARYDLQRQYEGYQQAFNTLSGVLKSFQDTAKSIIANLKA